MRIAVASDHAGYRVKTILAVDLARGGHEVVDFGTDSESPVDYPDFIRPAAEAVGRGDCDRAIVLGGSGNGEAMVANRTTGVRCALCWNVDSARLARSHNDANVLALGQRMITESVARSVVDAWLTTPYEGGRHDRRIAGIDDDRGSAEASETQRVRVAGVLVEDDRLLLVRQRVDPDRDWSLPGGKVEAGETLRDAIVREMREETGLDVRVLRLLYVADKPEDGLLHITFELGRRGGDLRRPDNEHDANPIADVRFVGVEDLCERGFTQTWRDLVRSGFADAPAYVGHKRNLGL